MIFISTLTSVHFSVPIIYAHVVLQLFRTNSINDADFFHPNDNHNHRPYILNLD